MLPGGAAPSPNPVDVMMTAVLQSGHLARVPAVSWAGVLAARHDRQKA